MKKHHTHATAPFALNGLLFKTDFNTIHLAIVHLAHFYNPADPLLTNSTTHFAAPKAHQQNKTASAGKEQKRFRYKIRSLQEFNQLQSQL